MAEFLGRPSKSWKQLMVPVTCGAVFLAAGCGIFYQFVISTAGTIREQRTWEQTSCLIKKSSVNGYRDSEGDRCYELKLAYTYSVKGTKYTGERFDDFGGQQFGTSRSRAEALAEALPAGGAVPCFYDPDDPQEAVISREWGIKEVAGGFIAVGFLLFGPLITIGLIRSMRHRGSWYRKLRAGGIQLVQKRNLGLDMAWPSSFALVFTAAAVMLVAQADCSCNDVTFGVVFGGTALGIDVWFVYMLLGLFSPRLRFFLDTDELRPGQKVKVRWELSSLTRVDTVSVTLVGREAATYTEGTESITDHSVFFRKVLLRNKTPGRKISGAASVAIPARAMHSLEASNNEIQWMVVCEADVAWWPDLDAEFHLQGEPDDPKEAPAPDTPRGATREDPPRHEGIIRIELDHPDSLKPGRMVTGTVGWNLEEPPDRGVLQLGWATRGKGDEDQAVVGQLELQTLPRPLAPPADVAGAPYRESPALEEQVPLLGRKEVRRFSILLPPGPHSFSGKLITLAWFLDVVLEPGEQHERRERLDITLAPGSREITLGRVKG